ncbi:sugar phosphate isomerase/epimerase family protein [Alicyclobacillus kakegawensis]|uniref:sugar phosphate isomerase/epimerase family protein n=1 Tax=Alicyclobacillus kakegawensis TaxID=392012 RepID=UPI001FE0D9D7|nr:sugar phosphate isomerase/epimerase family protein [Alicyclobacillus kakegawensis]
MAERLRASHIHIPVISGYTYFSDGAHGRNRDLEEFRKALQAAEILGARAVRTFFGHLPSHRASPELWDESLSALLQAVTLARAAGVEVWVETHYQTFADHPQAVLELMSAAGDENLHIIYDAANFHVDGVDPLAALSVLYPFVRHVHLKNYRWDHDCWYRSQPVSALSRHGDVDNISILRMLQQRGYSGYVSLEYFGARGWEALVQSLVECRSNPA